jgi:hypothetical protein
VISSSVGPCADGSFKPNYQDQKIHKFGTWKCRVRPLQQSLRYGYISA